jgi:NADH pyrophosphatase NudC (nudix superfamily)
MSYKFCPRCASPLHTAVVDAGPERLRCPACEFVHWDNPVPVVAAIVEHEGEIVLARNRAWPQKFFALITGFLEKADPDPASGVLREVEEELGLKTAKVGGFVGHYAFPRMNQLIIAYHVVAEGPIVLGEELVEYRKVPFDQLRPWPQATGLALRDWMLRRGLTPLPFLPPQ